MSRALAQMVECWTLYQEVVSWRRTAGSHCVVSLSKTLYPLLSTGSTQEDGISSGHDLILFGWDIKHQNKQTNMIGDAVLYSIFRHPEFERFWKIIFLISQPKHVLRVLKRTSPLRRFF